MIKEQMNLNDFLVALRDSYNVTKEIAKSIKEYYERRSVDWYATYEKLVDSGQSVKDLGSVSKHIVFSKGVETMLTDTDSASIKERYLYDTEWFIGYIRHWHDKNFSAGVKHGKAEPVYFDVPDIKIAAERLPECEGKRLALEWCKQQESKHKIFDMDKVKEHFRKQQTFIQSYNNAKAERKSLFTDSINKGRRTESQWKDTSGKLMFAFKGKCEIHGIWIVLDGHTQDDNQCPDCRTARRQYIHNTNKQQWLDKIEMEHKE